MDEYIRKQDAVEAVRQAVIREYCTDYGVIDSDVVYEVLDGVEPADVVSVVHAHWRDTGSGQECSVCKEIQYGYDTGRHYCANCGAKMDKE